MIITHLLNGARIHSRVEIYANPARPTIEMTVVRGEFSFEPTLELTYEQATSLRETLDALIFRIDEHAANQPITALHPRAGFLLEGGNLSQDGGSQGLAADGNGIHQVAEEEVP